MNSIFIIEDEIVVATCLERMLCAAGYTIAGLATSYKQAKQRLAVSSPDLILCDINLGEDRTGIDLIAELQGAYRVPFIFVSAVSDLETLQKASALCPQCYVTKPYSEKQLLVSIQRALLPAAEPQADQPTDRELTIISLIARGRSSKQIADELNISFNTVETHRKNLMKKYDVFTAPELACLATSRGWISYRSDKS